MGPKTVDGANSKSSVYHNVIEIDDTSINSEEEKAFKSTANRSQSFLSPSTKLLEVMDESSEDENAYNIQ